MLGTGAHCWRAWRAISMRVSTRAPSDSVPKLGPSANLAERSVLPFSASAASGGAKYLQACRAHPVMTV